MGDVMAQLGRPSEYTQEKADAICELLASGVSMTAICNRDDMPAYATVMKWQRENDEFLKASARAKEDGTHVLADQCLQIADSQEGDMIEVDGELRVNHDHINRAKLRIDTRMRLIGHWNSRKYGPKQEIDHRSSDGTMTPQTITRTIVDPKAND